MHNYKIKVTLGKKLKKIKKVFYINQKIYVKTA